MLVIKGRERVAREAPNPHAPPETVEGANAFKDEEINLVRRRGRHEIHCDGDYLRGSRSLHVRHHRDYSILPEQEKPQIN